jgi:hypothetical protein
MFNNFPILPLDDSRRRIRKKKRPHPKQSSPWIRLTGTHVKSVEAREEMTSRYFAAIYFHVVLYEYGPRVMTKEGV